MATLKIIYIKFRRLNYKRFVQEKGNFPGIIIRLNNVSFIFPSYELSFYLFPANYTVVSELLKTDYPHEAKNKDGQTAVHLASMTGQNDILGKLIESGASVNLRDSAGYSPLHYACQSNFPATVSSVLRFFL